MTREHRRQNDGNAAASQHDEQNHADPRQRVMMKRAQEGRAKDAGANASEKQAGGAQRGLPRVGIQDTHSCGAASQTAHLLVEDADLSPDDHRVFNERIGGALDYVTRNEARLIALLKKTSKVDDAQAAALVHRAQRHLGEAIDLAVPGAPEDAMAQAAKLAGDALFDAFGTSRGAVGMDEGQTEQVSALLHGRSPTLAFTQEEAAGHFTGDRVMFVSLDGFDSIFTNAVTTTLMPGEAAQIGWGATDGRRGGEHYFPLGRRESGTFYLIDQATGFDLEAASLSELRTKLVAAIDNGQCMLMGPGQSLRNATPSARRMASYKD